MGLSPVAGTYYTTNSKHFHASMLTLYCVMLWSSGKHFDNLAANAA